MYYECEVVCMKKVFLLIIRAVFAILSIIFFGLFVFPMAGNIINPGNIAGTALCVWVFCVCVAPLHRKIREFFSKRKFTKFLYRAVNFCFIAFAVYGAVVTSAMAVCAFQTPAENATAVVLGAQVKPWGPSVMLMGRIDAADEYLEQNADARAVLTGGQGSDEPVSEAQSMYDTLVERGVDPQRLYKEDRAENTTENIKYSMEIIKSENLNEDLAVVTDGFHQLRVRIIAAQQGIKGNVGAINSDTAFKYLPTFTVREWFAIPYQVLFR